MIFEVSLKFPNDASFLQDFDQLVPIRPWGRKAAASRVPTNATGSKRIWVEAGTEDRAEAARHLALLAAAASARACSDCV